MVRGKHSKLQKTARSHVVAHNRVAIEGACAIGGRDKEAALITDLDPRGCQVRTEAVGVTRSAALVLWLGEVGPIAGTLEWSKGGALGVQFNTPLDEGTLEVLLGAGEPPSNVVPLRV